MEDSANAKEVLINSFLESRASEFTKILEHLERILNTKDPFALYIATADKSNCSWIFDKKTLCSMLGGEANYLAIENQIAKDSEEDFVLFFILKKVGPLYSIRLEVEFLNEVLDELYNKF